MCVPMLGAVVAGVGSLMSGMAQAASYDANAKAMDAQAQSERETGAYESARFGEKTERMTGKQVTAIAAQGLDLSGTPLDVVVDSRTEAELDRAAIRANWQQKSNMSAYQAKVDRMNAKSARVGAVIGAIAPVINAFNPTSFTGIQGAFG